MKNAPAYAVSSVDHALQIAVMLQVEGPLSLSECARRLGIARSTAHRLLAQLVYRDFARQSDDRLYHAGPVISLAAHGRSRTALLRSVALPHLHALVERCGESVNLVALAGDYVRFIGSVECSQPLHVGNREGMVFPAHLTSGGKLILADLPPDEVTALYAEERWEGRLDQRPSLPALRRELTGVRRAGFALNRDRTETGVTAVSRPIRAPGAPAEAAVAISMPSARFRSQDLQDYLTMLAVTARDIEQDFARALADVG
ncbi:IclR family transcriptional regulator [Calidifontibacter sp. DB0510]|uniref:IclR family transcriptional regulator n=1 Tax=Metallococcus carri TaxID=1656884 RepID=A0A967EFR7_9MICO|nr:IclR family transcriptional regulator [Metallococcus carri]NHN54228.1 IclR family transcriptional regulator [Metallococcus carri]NOP36932.1 IclR family transcriptional regulator [Calidifontibacter sp. DB2511S]